MNNTELVLGKFLNTVVTMVILSDAIVEIEGEEFAKQTVRDGLIYSANRKIEETYGDRKTYTVYGEVKLRKGYIHPDDFIKGRPEVWYAYMKSSVYEGESAA